MLNFHPLIRVAVNRSLRNNIDAEDCNPLSDEQRETLERIYANEDGAFDALVREVSNRRRSMPMDGQMALDGVGQIVTQGPQGGNPHPFIDWLTHGGFAWLYSIAVIIAQMFGWRLPPLPPIPVPPPQP